MAVNPVLLTGAGLVVLGLLWLYRTNCIMQAVPKKALDLSPNRWTREQMHATYERLSKEPLDFAKHLPPKLNRRYIIVGGSGLVGGDIVLQLLQRGQAPESIRIVDFRPPPREDMRRLALNCDFARADITKAADVEAAFSKPWPDSVMAKGGVASPLTVFHTAATIRPGERHRLLYERVSAVNIGGTANVVAAARSVGASIFITTSSGSTSIRPVRFWTWPWRSAPDRYTQIFDESDFDKPLRPLTDYFANYAHSKAVGERLVCHENEDTFRTGSLRPGNGIYGQNNDQLVGNFLTMRRFASWSPHVIQNYVSGRNVALAHLQFEAALARPVMPPCAGRPFVITDNGPPPSFSDLYRALAELPVTPVRVDCVAPVVLLLFSYLVEAWCITLAKNPQLTEWLGLREPGPPIVYLQPGTFNVASHMIADDSAARKSIEDGGIGYTGVCTSLEGVCEQIVGWNREKMRASGEATMVNGGLVNGDVATGVDGSTQVNGGRKRKTAGGKFHESSPNVNGHGNKHASTNDESVPCIDPAARQKALLANGAVAIQDMGAQGNEHEDGSWIRTGPLLGQVVG